MRESRILLCFTLIMLHQGAFGQSWNWVKSGGGSLSDKATDMDLDAQGNVYVCGYYNSTSSNDVSFGNITGGIDFGKEGFLARMTPSGTWTWLKWAFGGWDERVLGMHVDKVNNFIYVTGTAWYMTDFGSCTNGIFPGGSDEIFVAKFDLNGNCQWILGAGGDTDDHGYDLVTDSSGNIYLTGYISDKYSMGNVVAHFGTLNVPIAFADSLGFVAKISPGGIFQWVKSFHGVEGERDNRIAIDKDANVYVTGGFHGTNVTLGNATVSSSGGTDIYVIKFDNLGNQQWVQTAGSTLDDRGNSIWADIFGDIYVTGEFRHKAGFGLDTINNNGGPSGRDIFVAKMDVNGNWKWAKKAGSGKGSERGNRIIGNQQGNLFVTGQIKGNADFGSQIHLTNNDSIQLFVAAIDTSGKWRWALQAGSPVIDRGNGLAADDSCNLYVCGYFEQTASFGSTQIIAKGKKDAVVAHIPNACFPYIPSETITEDTCILHIPNVFSPNGDGNNDVFFIPDSCVIEMSMHIYNRWGVEVHSLDEPLEGWNGMCNGQPASEGVYYYVGKATLNDNRMVSLKGFITLLRQK